MIQSAGLESEYRHVAIMGGTFDPIHYGHLRSAADLKRRLGVDELRLLPCGEPPHRQLPQVEAKHRWNMLRLALQEFPELTADDRELQRPGPSYSVETLESLRQELGPQCALCLVIGMDAFLGLSKWHRWRELIQLAHLVVIARPGYRLPASGPEAELIRSCTEATQDWILQPAGAVIIEELQAYDISATGIREAIAKSQPPAGCTPQAVLDYIDQHALYRN